MLDPAPVVRSGSSPEPDPDESAATAARAGLRYVSDADPGIRRERRGRGFTFRLSDGSRPSDRRIEAIRAMAIPPAWVDVWICTDPRGHLQATGRDDRGRKQYRYHPEWRRVRDEVKFARLAEFGAALPDVRNRIDADLSRPGLPHAKVVALAVGLLDRTLVRVGNDEYRRCNGTFGLTTLRSDHVEVQGAEVALCFVGKGGADHEVTIRDPRFARAVRRCHELGGKELFTYRGDDGLPVRIDSADCNDYLAAVVAEGVTVKYFRTWGATVTVVNELVGAPGDDPTGNGSGGSGAVDRALLAAIDRAASRLGNTRAVCRASYLHPLIADAHRSGDLIDLWRASRATGRMSRAERATLKLLQEHAGPR
jgi:DNA topoisomerase I